MDTSWIIDSEHIYSTFSSLFENSLVFHFRSIVVWWVSLLCVSVSAHDARYAVNDHAGIRRPLLIMHVLSKTEIWSRPSHSDNNRLNLAALTGFRSVAIYANPSFMEHAIKPLQMYSWQSSEYRFESLIFCKTSFEREPCYPHAQVKRKLGQCKQTSLNEVHSGGPKNMAPRCRKPMRQRRTLSLNKLPTISIKML